MNDLTPLIIAIVVVIFVFILIREILMWYYKINKRIELLEENNVLLRKILMKLPDEPLKSDKEEKQTVV